jgi:hypothetical protein
LPVIFVIAGLVSSCGSAKYVPNDKYLLDKYSIKTESKEINQEELVTYVKQKPNKKNPRTKIPFVGIQPFP